MKILSLEIPAVKIIEPVKHGDERGFFSETYNKKDLAQLGVNTIFVQDNHSLSGEKHVLRGLHFQTPPFAQDKLVRVVKGSILDVVVDLRSNSKTFGKYVTAIISAERWNQILVPIGFAHGFLTLEENTEVIYKVSNYYSKNHDSGLIWNDSQLNIDWGVTKADIILSEKDANLPNFSSKQNYF